MNQTEVNDSKEKHDYFVWPKNTSGRVIKIKATDWSQSLNYDAVQFWDGSKMIAYFPYQSIFGWGRFDAIELDDTTRVAGCVS